MAESRREKIEAMLQAEPGDTFLRYSLALELAKEDREAEALELLGGLCKDEPPYVPAFFRTAQILSGDGVSEDAERVGLAREFLRKGIEVARTQGDLHAAGEMSELLSELGSLGE